MALEQELTLKIRIEEEIRAALSQVNEAAVQSARKIADAFPKANQVINKSFKRTRELSEVHILGVAAAAQQSATKTGEAFQGAVGPVVGLFEAARREAAQTAQALNRFRDSTSRAFQPMQAGFSEIRAGARQATRGIRQSLQGLNQIRVTTFVILPGPRERWSRLPLPQPPRFDAAFPNYVYPIFSNLYRTG